MKNRIFSYILILTLLIVTAGCGSEKQAELNTQDVVETTAADTALTEKQTETESIKETESENMTEESSEENVDIQEEVEFLCRNPCAARTPGWASGFLFYSG